MRLKICFHRRKKTQISRTHIAEINYVLTVLLKQL